VNAMKDDKYWNALPDSKEFFYVVALSRARIRSDEGNVATVTHVGKVILDRSISKFCSRGKVLLVSKQGSNYKAMCVITWPAFLNIMHSRPTLFCNVVARMPISQLVDVKKARELMNG